ncbi:MAG: hypothetical protein AAF636_19320 [Pseudomonadota bacterium]
MTWEVFSAKAEILNKKQRAETLKWINQSLRNSLVSGYEVEDLSCQRLARLMLLKALSITDEGQSTGAYKPAWTQLKEKVNTFAEALPEAFDGLKHTTFTDDTIGQFATLSSRKKGSSSKYFYSTILMFLIHEASSGGLDSDYMKLLAPRSDRLYPLRVVKLISDRLDGLQPVPLERTREIRQTFNVKETLHQKFVEYVQRRSVECGRTKINQLSLVIYRPTRREPCRLMKTFMSIYERRSEHIEASGFDYTHIYQPPEEGGQDRLSTGKVIPLDDALYLVGGQRPLEGHDKPIPFSSMKAVAIRWADIGKNHDVFPVIAMTTNYDGQLLATRAVARLSPIGHSDDMSELRTVDLTELANSLERDQEVERSYVKAIENITEEAANKVSELFPLTKNSANCEKLAADISRLCNNDPHTDHGWAAPPDFSLTETDPLTTEALQYKVSQAMRGSKGKSYTNNAGMPFNLWNHTRFGPLSIE